MKHIFIINPVAGQGGRQAKLIQELRERELAFYVTQSAEDCERRARELCEKNQEGVRIYACGGDGTLSEVVNGVAGFDHAEAGCVPLGSGNDFIRNFGIPSARFREIDRQLAGRAVDVDLIRYEATVGPNVIPRYAVNMFNIGFDCAVVDTMSRIKRFPLARGSFGYLLSIAAVIIKKPSFNLSIVFDDGTRRDGNALLTAVANGCFCGGGLKGMPLARVDDGLIDVCAIDDVPRRTLFSVLPKFARGTHLEDKKVKGKIVYKKRESLSIHSPDGSLRLCADGNTETVDAVKFSIEKKKLRFALPE